MQQPEVEQYGHADVTVEGDTWRVRLAGEISLEVVSRLDEVRAQVAEPRRGVEVDLDAVTFIDSNGIGFLARLAFENPGQVRVVNAAPFTRDLLRHLGLARALTIVDP